MLFSYRVPLKTLIDLCRRLSIALGAGIDVRTVWMREAQRAQGPLRDRLLQVAFAIQQGESLAEALAPIADCFPALFREMIVLGEQTGHVDTVLTQLADHYQNQLNSRRIFYAAIAWPVIQLTIAVVIVGFLIWIMGMLRETTGNRTLDILGFGLVGNSGLAAYVAMVACATTVIWLVLRAISRGLVWTYPVQRFVLRLPGIGRPLQTLALARLAWSMHVTLGAGMEVRRALRLSLANTQNARYIDHMAAIDAAIMAGHSIHEAFCRTGDFPVEFLDMLAVGEQSGEVSESMGRLAKLYQEQARMALAVLAMIAGWLVWAAVAAVLITLIFRIFSFYLGALSV
jgi:type II secretory pathway component PulF